MDLDEEYQLVCENDQLAFEIRFCQAETAVLDAQIDHMLIADMDDSPAVHDARRHVERARRIDTSHHSYQPPTTNQMVERCCYEHRRHRGEWPTGPQLAERIAADAGMTYAMAEFLIDQAINERTDDARLYLALRLLGDEPRLFVDAEAVNQAEFYDGFFAYLVRKAIAA